MYYNWGQEKDLQIDLKFLSPSHSRKLMGGGGFLGSILTTLDSTFGGGRKLFLPTFMRWSTRARSCVLMDSRQ